MAIIKQFNVRLVGGEISSEKLKQFNSLRHTLISQKPEYAKYLDKKGWAIRMMIDVFLGYPSIVLELAEKLDGVKHE